MERVWTWLHEIFPERQIYIRSDGRVQFFSFSSSLQATLAGLTLIFLGWVAFSTVNVVFKDRIIAAKDHRYQQMQSAYENRMADLQQSYDELNGSLVSDEDRFKQIADELQAKQNIIVSFLGRKRQVDTLLSHPDAKSSTPFPSEQEVPDVTGSDDGVLFDTNGSDDAVNGGSILPVMPQPAQPQPRTGKPTHASLLDFGGAITNLTGILFGNHPAKPIATSATVFARHPALKVITEQTKRVGGIDRYETALMTQAGNDIAGSVGTIRSGVTKHWHQS
ncbi:MAG: DUF5930 domain-containing protein [Rhizomicrobium sp.]